MDMLCLLFQTIYKNSEKHSPLSEYFSKKKKKMEKKPSKKTEASGSAPERPKVFTALCRDPKYRKANAEFLTRRLRLEFDKLTTTRPLCKASAAPREFHLPPELQKCHQSNFRTNTKKSRKRSRTLLSIRNI